MKSDLMMFPYFRACFQFNGDNRPVHITELEPLHLILNHDLIQYIIDYKKGCLPSHPGTIALMIRAADYLGDVWTQVCL